jgi:hypothetical protein
VHIQHEFYGGVPYILRPTNWCTSQWRRSSVNVENDGDLIMFSIL